MMTNYLTDLLLTKLKFFVFFLEQIHFVAVYYTMLIFPSQALQSGKQDSRCKNTVHLSWTGALSFMKADTGREPSAVPNEARREVRSQTHKPQPLGKKPQVLIGLYLNGRCQQFADYSRTKGSHSRKAHKPRRRIAPQRGSPILSSSRNDLFQVIFRHRKSPPEFYRNYGGLMKVEPNSDTKCTPLG